MSRRPLPRWLRIATIAAIPLVLAAVCLGILGGLRHKSQERRSWTRSSSTLELAVEDGVVAAAYADRVDAGELTQAQAEALTMLDINEGSYDQQSVVLQGTTKERATEIAKTLGAEVRTTRDGSYAQLTLPTGMDIASVYALQEAAAFVAEMEPDWHVRTTEVVSTDEGDAGADDASELYEADVENLAAVAMQPHAKFNDPYYPSQAYLSYLNCGDTLASAEGEAPLIAIIDTGIDTDNPEFAGRISEYSYNATEDKVVKDFGIEVIEDEQGHGTSVAGVLTAAVNNNVGIAGMVPNGSLLVIKANADAKGNFVNASDLVFGLYYAIERGADVVNMSFGVDAEVDPFASAVKLAKDSDVFLVASAGNKSSATLWYPAANKDVIGVGALADGSWELASYSSFGDENIDLVAPGTVLTTSNEEGGEGVHGASGTSMAAPLVTAAVARYKALHAHAENEAVAELLRASAQDLGEPGRDMLYGYGVLDVDGFINGEVGTITFDMLTDEIPDVTRRFYVGKTLQDVPMPEREDVLFEGWYYDDQLSEPYDYQRDVLRGDENNAITVYAAWGNEDESQLFGYQAADGTDCANGIEITSYLGRRGYVTVPRTIDGYQVVGIAAYALSPAPELDDRGILGGAAPVGYVLPDSLRYIEEGAFKNSTRLATIEIPDGVERIEKDAFYGCCLLGKVEFGADSNLISLGTMAFAYCSSLRSFTVGPRVTTFEASVLLGDGVVARVSVADANTTFVLDASGNVVSRDGTTLVYHPAALGGSFEVPDGITTVDDCALAYSHATQVTLPQGVERIGGLAFAYSSVVSMAFPSSLTSIGGLAFEGCQSLLEADLSDTSVQTISGRCFEQCDSLESVSLPSTLKKIEEKAFYNDYALRSIVLPEGLEVVESEAFRQSGLRSVTFPASISTLQTRAFAYCLSLQEVTLPASSGLRVVTRELFYCTPRLVSVTLPEGVLTIEEQAFGDSALKSIALPASVTRIERGAFANCNSLAHVSVAEGNTTFKAVDDVLFDAQMGTLLFYPAGRAGASYTIPEGVRTITGYAFSGAANLESCTVPTSVTELPAFAFSHADALREVNLPEGLTFVGPNCFEYCLQLEQISIPASVKGLGRYVFFGDYALTSVTFAEGSHLSRIGFAAMAYCGLRSFRIPASVSTMAQYAFAGCTNLIGVSFDDGSQLDVLPAYVFENCRSLTALSFGEGSQLTRIAARALEGMPVLAQVDLSRCNALEAIGNYCFYRDFALEQVALPQGLREVGRYAFYGCTSLPSLTMPQNLGFIGRYAFTTPDSTMSINFEAATLPSELQEDWDYHIAGYYLGSHGTTTSGDWVYAALDDGTVAAVRYLGSASSVSATTIDGKPVSSLGYGCFRGNATLQDIELSDQLTSICDYAFSGCTSLEEVVVPASTGFVGGHAFEGSGVSRVSFAQGSSLASLGDSVFEDTRSLSSIVVPAEVTKIGRRAFMGSSVADVDFEGGSKLESVGAYAFANAGITHINLPSSLRQVGDYAFYNTSQLSEIELGASPDLKIQSHAFYGCGASTVSLPAGVSYIGEMAFDAMTELTEFVVSEANQHYAASEGVLYNKELTSLVTYPAGRTGQVTIPRGVSSIRFGAFEGSRIGSVRFEEGSRLSTIGYRAFNKCKELTSVSGLPAGVLSIDRYAFSECDALTSIDLSDATNLGTIGRSAFYNCVNLTESFQMPDTVQEIGDRAFYGCSGLTTAIPATSHVRTIGDGAFAYSGVTSLSAPSGLVSIGAGAFQGSALSTLDLDNGALLELGTNAFRDCSNFATAEIVIPACTTYIGSGALQAARGIVTDLTLPVPAAVDEGTVFSMTYLLGGMPAQLKRVTISAAVELYESMFEEITTLETLILPDGPTTIPSSMCSNCISLSTVRIPATVRRIESSAFAWAPLWSFELPESLVYIGDYALNGCYFNQPLPSALEHIGDFALGMVAGGVIHVPASVSYIGAAVFSTHFDGVYVVIDEGNTCYANYGDDMVLTADGETLVWVSSRCEGKLVIPDGVKNIQSNVLRGLPKITEIEFPSTLVQEYGTTLSLADCLALETVNVPASLAGLIELSGSTVRHIVVEEGATELPMVNYCRSLESIVIPSTVKALRSNEFLECFSLTSIELPEGLERIGAWAFADCTGLERLVIPASVTDIDGAVYAGCTSLHEVVVAEGNTHFAVQDGSLYTADMHTLLCVSQQAVDFAIPDGVTNFDGAFYKAARLRSLALPEGLTSIADFAFTWADELTSVHIPSTVVSIGNSAFFACSKLAEVTGGEGIVSVGLFAFRATAALQAAESTNQGLYIGRALVYVPDVPSFEVREGTRYITQRAGEGRTQLRFLSLPSSLVGIAQDAFKDCTSLKDVSFSEGLLRIESSAFENTDIRSLELPSTLEFIGSFAFGESIGSTMGSLERIAFAPGARTRLWVYAFNGQTNIKTVVYSAEMLDASIERESFEILPTIVRGGSIVIQEGVGHRVEDISLDPAFGDPYVGANIYCFEDERSTTWHDGWADGNTVHYLGSWNLATFRIDGKAISCKPVRLGQVVELPSESEVRNALSDTCSLVMDGWDIDGDGRADTVPATLNEATGNLVAEAVYRTHSWADDPEEPATCTETGHLQTVCTVCGKQVTEELPPLGHAWGEGIITGPTDTEDGYTTYVCERCGVTEQRDWTPALGDEAGDWTVVAAPTCTDEGLEGRFSTAGHLVESRPIAATGHVWDEGSVEMEPTCLDHGLKMFRCEHDSSHTKTEPLEALGHEWGDWSIELYPSYVSEGSRWRDCNRCTARMRETMPQLIWVDAGGVTLSVNSVDLAPGETIELTATLTNEDASDPAISWTSEDASVASVDGNGTVYALAEGTTWIVATASDGTSDRCEVTVRHRHTSGEVVRENEVDPTCEEVGGYDLVTYCVECGEETSRERVEIPAIGHDWEDEGFFVIEPGCEIEGLFAYVCKHDSQHAKTETVPALGHEAGEQARDNEMAPTCDGAGGYDLVTRCMRCGKVLSSEHVEVPAIGHDWDEGVVTTAPTCEADGIRTLTCRNASWHTTEVAEPATGHVWDEGAITIEPGCTTEGERLYTCLNDASHTMTEPIASLGHDYEVTTVPATWDEGGCVRHRCVRCGDEYVTDETESLREVAERNARPVSEAIAALPPVGDLTLADEPVVAAARASYHALADTEKALVTNLEVLERAEARIADLTAADAVSSLIRTLPALGDLALTDSTAVSAARTAYEALSEMQRSLVDPDALASLEAAEARIAVLQEEAEQAEADAQASAGAVEAIAALPEADAIAIEDAGAISAARTAYEALTDSQKALVDPEVLAALELAEARVAGLMVEALPSVDELTLADADAVEAARAAYDALTERWKEEFQGYDDLVAAETRIGELEQHEVDIAAARTVASVIVALPASSDITLGDEGKVAAARAAYDALTPEQKLLVGNYAALEAAEAALAQLRLPSLVEAEVAGVADAVYTGKAVAQTPVVTLGGETLEEGVDYVVSGVSEAIGAGTYQLTVSGVGAYRGSKTLTWTIDKAANPAKLALMNRQVLVKSAKRKAVGVANPVSVSDAVGRVTYAKASTEAKFKKWKVNATSGKVTVPKGTKKGTYRLKVKVTAAGGDNHLVYSTVVTAKVQVVNKYTQPLVATAVTRTASATKLGAKAVTVARPLAISKAQGKVTYKKAKGPSALSVDAKTGKVTVKRGTKAGTYAIKIKVSAAGNANYAAGTKTVTCEVVVK